MNDRYLFYALLDMAVSLLAGIILIVVSLWAINKFLRKRYGIEKKNTSWAIFQVGVLLSIALVMHGVSEPFRATLKLLEQAGIEGIALTLNTIKYLLVFLVVGMASGILLSLTGIILYSRMTHIDEFEEIKQNNTAVALVTAAVMVLLALLGQSGVQLLMESFVPWPSMPVAPN